MEHQSGRNITEEHLAKLAEEFKHFIRDRGYTAEQMSEAYYLLLEGSSAEGTSEDVQNIYKEMHSMVEQGNPINRLARLIEGKQKYEDSPIIFSRFVDGMEVTDREKSTLHSIVDRLRSGHIECFTPRDGVIGSFHINSKNATKEDISAILLMALERLIEHVPEGGKFGFTFSED